MRSWQVVAGLAVLAVAAQFYGVYRPAGPPTPPWFPNADKVEHAVGFGLPVALVLAALTLRAQERDGRLSRFALGVVVAIFAGHAVLSEIIQHLFYRSRTGDPLDVAADSLGIALGVGVYGWVMRRSAHRVPR